MVEFDRVFDRDDVMVAVLVQIVDAGGQRRRLAGTGRPVTSTSPLGRWSSSFKAGGVPNCSMLSRSTGICRSTIPVWPRCLKIETRNRALSPKAKPKSAPAPAIPAGTVPAMLFISETVSCGSEPSSPTSRAGREAARPAAAPRRCAGRCARLTTVSSSLSIRIVPISSYLVRARPPLGPGRRHSFSDPHGWAPPLASLPRTLKRSRLCAQPLVRRTARA